MCSCHSILERCVTFFGVKMSIRSFVLFSIWQDMELIFTDYLQIASQMCVPNFKAVSLEIANLLTFVLFKSAKAHGKNYIKVRPPLVRHL